MQSSHPSSGQGSQGLRPAQSGPAKIAPIPVQKMPDIDLEPLSLVDDEPAASSSASAQQSVAPASKIRQFSVPGQHAAHAPFKRQPHTPGRGAVRVRTFHGRLSDEGMAYMDDKINEWVDGHPEIETKFVTTAIGTYEGKIREPALVVNVWY